MTLLCIDDDLEDLELLSEAVKSVGPEYSCIITTNGEEGLFLLHSVKPTFVFLDMNMPLIDGRMVLKAIRLDQSLDSIKVCILSTSMTSSESQAYRKLGANFCIRKPNTFAELTTLVTSIIQ